MYLNEQQKRKPIAHVTDARNRSITLLDPYELQLLRRHDIVEAEPLQTIVEEVGFGLPKWQQRGYLACVFTFFACVVFLIIWKLVRGTGIDMLERVLWPLNLAVFAFGAWQFWRSARRGRAKHICQVMLQHRRCPHCGYDLRLLPADPTDGATICPECGCAWWIDDYTDVENPTELRRDGQTRV